MTTRFLRCAGFVAGVTLLSGMAFAQKFQPTKPVQSIYFEELEDGSIVAADPTGTYVFADRTQYARSDFFRKNGMRCGSDKMILPLALGTSSDCSDVNTNPDPAYGTSPTRTINVVFHVIMNTNGQGNVTDTAIAQQMDVLNAKFAPAGIAFNLAGTTRSTSRQWYNDRQSYWTSLAWDTTKYLNIYTNTAGGNLGYAYVPSGGGVVGNSWDRVVIYWPTIGNPAPYGAPYDLGLTTVHEVGHYLGLYHTFQGGCTSTSGCNQNGDLICDTNPESSPNYSPCSRTTCGSPDPTDNYMDYSDDACMSQFTTEQQLRMNCTLEHYRSALVSTGGTPPGKATSPSPANGATGVSTGATLSWSAGSGATSHDVYFGTSTNPASQGNQTATTFNPGTLAAGTTYYWRVDEVNADGTTTGDLWSFTTASGGGGSITLSAVGTKKGKRYRAELTWSGATGANVEIYRDGALLTTTANDGAYNDNLGRTPNASYSYQVCEVGGAVCSNTATVNF